MKLSTILVLVLLALTFIPKGFKFPNIFPEPTPKPGNWVFNRPMNEGFVAFAVNDYKAKEPDVVKKCDCNGTGMITHGDGHKTKCPYVNPKTGKCEFPNVPTGDVGELEPPAIEKKEEGLPPSDKTDLSIELAIPRPLLVEPFTRQTLFKNPPPRLEKLRQILYFTATWCGPCRNFKRVEVPKLQASGIKVGESVDSQIRIIDVDKFPELYTQYGFRRNIPLFVLTEDGAESASLIGYHTSDQIISLLNFKKK